MKIKDIIKFIAFYFVFIKSLFLDFKKLDKV